MNWSNYLLFCFIVQLSACSTTSTEQTYGGSTPKIEYRKPYKNEIVIIGTLIDIKSISEQDYTIAIEDSTSRHLLNFVAKTQEINKTEKQLKRYSGKRIKAYFQIDTLYKAVDIHHKNKSILGEIAPLPCEEWLEFSGVLSGADTISEDTSTNSLVVKSAEDKQMVFKSTLSKNLKDLNKQDITVFYELVSTSKITHIQLITE